MGEAGLGAAEVGEKIAEHREHSMHAQPTGRDRIITIIEAALLAVGRARWPRGRDLRPRSGAPSHDCSSRKPPRREPRRTASATWPRRTRISTRSPSTLGSAPSLLATPTLRMSRSGASAPSSPWHSTRGSPLTPSTTSTHPPGPPSCLSTSNPSSQQAADLDAKANELAEEGAKSAETADRYVRITVFLASVLFLVGISGHFPPTCRPLRADRHRDA